VFVVTAVIAIAAAGCGSGANEAGRKGGPAARASRVERCTQRMLQGAEKRPEHVTRAKAEVERYIRTTYCTPFERDGWVYDDGTLAIGAYFALANGGTCATSRPGEPARTVPCQELDRSGPKILDCALLHHVRQSEVQDYVEKLKEGRTVSCDDGTPLAELGAE
jgi:uncharacterized protein YjhX (UPF0386 family)